MHDSFSVGADIQRRSQRFGQVIVLHVFFVSRLPCCPQMKLLGTILHWHALSGLFLIMPGNLVWQTVR